ncbi:MAG: deoxynucleoside kinase [Chloroflexi bacterium]|nr:deoxynucleoside kinase [Chloroflexota bacterium]
MYIAIEGVIGVGKTTLARLLQPSFDAEIQMEVFEENPFLANFYEDRERYAFQTQIFFLLSRYHQQRQAVKQTLKAGRNLIMDYTFAKDALFAQVNLEGDELKMYHRVHDALGEKITLPDLVVYLQADASVLMQRITQRDRPYERNMQVEYIELLNEAYNAFYSDQHDSTHTLTIECGELDFVGHAEHLNLIENRVKQALKLVPFQSELPLEVSGED